MIIACYPIEKLLSFSAETNANAEGTIQGTLDTELSDIGYKQAKVLGQHLQYHRFTHIYSSDLRRASEVYSYIILNKRNISLV